MTDLVVLSPRLPYRTRARLQAVRHLDRIGCALVEHGHTRGAEIWWRTWRLY